MRKKSDINAIKSVAKSFVYIEVTKTSLYPMFVMHPIFETGIQAIKVNGEMKMVDIIANEDNLKQVQNQVCETIDSAATVYDVYLVIRKSYRLTFIKYIKEYLSVNDMSELLAHAWVTNENPNGDVNVSLKTIVKWFKSCNKTILMDEQEYKVYKDFPECLTVYRGVAINRNPHGLSWTTDYSKAEWFAHRYDTGSEEGYILKADISRSNILAYFDSRGESEVVVNVFELNKNSIEKI